MPRSRKLRIFKNKKQKEAYKRQKRLAEARKKLKEKLEEERKNLREAKDHYKKIMQRRLYVAPEELARFEEELEIPAERAMSAIEKRILLLKKKFKELF